MVQVVSRVCDYVVEERREVLERAGLAPFWGLGARSPAYVGAGA